MTDSFKGAGNIADVGTKSVERKDQDVIPESAVRPSQDGRDYHTGRGGAGNEKKSDEKKTDEEVPVVEKPAAPVTHRSLADRLKAKLFGIGKK